MNEYFASTLPQVGAVSHLLIWLMLAMVIMAGALVLFIYRCGLLEDRVAELERELREQRAARAHGDAPAEPDILPVFELAPPEDDRPIPLVRHRYGDASTLLQRRKSDTYTPEFVPEKEP